MQEQIKKLKATKTKLIAIVEPFLKDNISHKDRLELAHLAKFIVSFDESIKIIEKRESPDFIIEYKGNFIGLEIERIFNLEEVANIKSKEAVFNKAALEFEKKYSDSKVLANFWVTDGYEFTGKEIQEIAEFTYQTISGVNPAYPPYIKKILFMKHSGVSFNYNEGAYMPTEITGTSLDENIRKKEKKIANYKANTGINSQWLLLISGIGSDSFDLDDFELRKPIESQFEHIYLLQDFEAKIITLK